MDVNTCKIPINAQMESSHSQPEDFDLVSHPNLVIQGMNQLRNSGQLLDVKLIAEGKTFKVSKLFKNLNFRAKMVTSPNILNDTFEFSC